ncbi:MAG: nicotinate-nucleotide adenylyltransferase [Tannerellaceae bacterium]|jgi:nicotinate-nucleotide adenylyltransferase|nr:nicotinate-nucleotide adenylyltransferase [Tannerellaceae bacterium]
MIKTGIFSGSFNPVHIGHLALANWICEYEDIDEVWFVVTPQSPLKSRDDLMDDSLRLRMVESAVKGYPKFVASDFEFTLPRPSYSADMLREIERSYPDRSFHFIIGADNWAIIDKWKDCDGIIGGRPVLVYPRLGYEVVIPSRYGGVRKVDAPVIEVSSAFIRRAIREGRDVRFFLPESVWPYMEALRV